MLKCSQYENCEHFPTRFVPCFDHVGLFVFPDLLSLSKQVYIPELVSYLGV